jgi:hypothetical protein
MKGGTNSDKVFVQKLIHGIAEGSSIFSNGVARAMKKILETVNDPEGLKEPGPPWPLMWVIPRLNP